MDTYLFNQLHDTYDRINQCPDDEESDYAKTEEKLKTLLMQHGFDTFLDHLEGTSRWEDAVMAQAEADRDERNKMATLADLD